MSLKQRIKKILGYVLLTQTPQVGPNRPTWAIFLLASLLVSCWGSPTESELKKNFFENEATFNKLIEMAHTDKEDFTLKIPSSRYHDGNKELYVQKNTQFSEPRFNEYQLLLKKTRFLVGIDSFNENVRVVLDWSGSGYLYAYSFTPDPEATVSSYDECEFTAVHRECFVPLKDKWYMTFW